jgi:hypothetical protein
MSMKGLSGERRTPHFLTFLCRMRQRRIGDKNDKAYYTAFDKRIV